MPAIQNLSMYAAEDATFTLYARDRSNVPLSLTGSSLSWRVGRGPYSLDLSWPTFSKSGTITDSANGIFTVSVSPTDTQYLEGDYQHEAWVTNVSGQMALVTEGRFRIKPYIQS